MTFRISQYTVLCGVSLLALSATMQAQAPRYQSPLSTPAAPQPQALPTPPAITPNGVVVEDIVVRVNDQIINRSDVERSQQQLTGELQQNGATPAEAAERQKNMLRDMIDQQLLLSRGKELGLNADNEVIRRLDEIRKQNHLDAIEEKDCSSASCTSLEKAARQQGVSFEDFKANIRNGVITQQVVRDEVGRRIQMTQGQEQAFYEAHKQEFAQPEQIRLSEILVPTPADANDATVAQAKEKAEGISAKVKAGQKFEELAEEYSGGPTASQGGDLGLFKRGALAKVLEDQTFPLPAGQATEPIRTRQGFVILKVTEHQAPGVPAMKDIEPQIQEAIYMQSMQPALRAYLTKLREDAYIDIRPGFVDSGASPRQTKPILTAYAAPVPKKKKKAEQKQRFDRGGRFSTASKTPATAPEAKPAVATPAPVDTTSTSSDATAATSTAATSTAATSTTTTPAPTTTKTAAPAKPKKIKKEKVRYGQAPRNSLPPGPQETATGTDAGAGAASAAVTPGGIMDTPTTPAVETAQVSAEGDPLAPKAPELKKTRYSARAKEIDAEKAAQKAAHVKEKAANVPTPLTTDEKNTQAVQSAPLGLNGDTTPKKPKKEKGAPKERLQNKEKVTPVEPPPPDPTVNPSLGATPPGVTPLPPPNAAPPANAPAPQAQPAAPPANTPAPQAQPATPPVPQN